MKAKLTDRGFGRLVTYRRLLEHLRADRTEYVFSHTLAGMAGLTAAQVRRDVMDLGYLGNPAKGYRVTELMDRIGQALDPPAEQRAVLAGAGRLASALVPYFDNWSPRLRIVGVFDNDTCRICTLIHGHRVLLLSELPRIVEEYHVDVGVVAVPAEAAPDVARMMIQAGVKGILNFAPVPLDVPAGVYVEQVDLTVSIERVAYMARRPMASECDAKGGVDSTTNVD